MEERSKNIQGKLPLLPFSSLNLTEPHSLTFINTLNDFEYRLMGQISTLEMLTLYVDEGRWTLASIKGKISNLKKGLGKMAKNQSLPAHLQERDSMGEDDLNTHEYHDKPTAYRSRPSLPSPRSTNDIVGAPFLRANPSLLRSAANRVPTNSYVINWLFKFQFL